MWWRGDVQIRHVLGEGRLQVNEALWQECETYAEILGDQVSNVSDSSSTNEAQHSKRLIEQEVVMWLDRLQATTQVNNHALDEQVCSTSAGRRTLTYIRQQVVCNCLLTWLRAQLCPAVSVCLSEKSD
jgi:Coiled-coil domain-containing protein 24 family